MVDPFEGREKAAENKFSHDIELNFKINARAHKLLGLWAAAHMAMNEADAKEYAMEIVDVDFNAGGDGNVIDRVYADLQRYGSTLDKEDIGEELVHCLDVARHQIYNL